MKNNTRLLFALFPILFILLFSNCGEEAISGPTRINLTNSAIYEALPANTNVATLSTDIVDGAINFRLVSGDGDANNGDFVIKGTILQTQKILNFSDGNSRSIRIQANDGMTTYEQAITITVNQFVGTYPSITSTSFENNGQMPKEFGADNGNISPDLDIMDVPSSTVSILLAMNDFDDGNGFHWAVWNIPPDKTKISRNEPWGQGNVVVGENNYGTGYTGPFPPREHRYQITTYFLSETLDLAPGDFQILIPTITGKIIAQTSIIGKYRPQ